MKKLHKLVVLPLDRKPQLHDIIFNDKYFLMNDGADIHFAWKDRSKPQQLLLVSNDAIKLDDIYIDDTNSIRKSITSNADYWSVRKDYKKIIASYPSISSLPTFSETFIKEWVNNPVMEIEVEYENNRLLNDSIVPFPSLMNELADYADIPKMKLKLTEKNEVICSIPKTDNLFNDADFKEEKDIEKIVNSKYSPLSINDWKSCSIYHKYPGNHLHYKQIMNERKEDFLNGIKWYKEYLKNKSI